MRSLVVLAAVALAATGCAPAVALTTTDEDPPAVLSPSPSASPASPSPSPPTASSPPARPAADAPAAATAPVGSFVLGDSISLGAGPRLARLGYPVVGRVGQSASDAYLTTHLATPAAQEAPAWVIVLGTNNPGDPADVARVSGWLDTVDRLRSAGAPQDVFWVTPFRDPRYGGGLSVQGLDAFNAELARQAAQRPWLHLVDFAAVAALHPEWFDADGSHLHPDETGYGVLAALIAGPDAVPMLSPAPLQTLDGPTSLVDEGPAHPTARPSATRTPSAKPSPAEPSAAPQSPSPQSPTAPATDAPSTTTGTGEPAAAEAGAAAPLPEFSPAG